LAKFSLELPFRPLSRDLALGDQLRLEFFLQLLFLFSNRWGC
jgi:hypothetical protein